MTKLLAAALLAASASAALAQPGTQMAVHNDSLMNIVTDPAGVVRISYKARLADRDGKVIYLTNLRQG